jgi:hypothetical protein
MISFTTAFVAVAAVAGVLASPAGTAPAELTKRNSPNAQGTNNGYFYQFCMFTVQDCFDIQGFGLIPPLRGRWQQW